MCYRDNRNEKNIAMYQSACDTRDRRSCIFGCYGNIGYFSRHALESKQKSHASITVLSYQLLFKMYGHQWLVLIQVNGERKSSIVS